MIENMIDGWMITLLISIITVASSFAVIKNKVNEGRMRDTEQDVRLKMLEQFMNEKRPLLDHLSKVESSFGSKLDMHGNNIVELRQKVMQSPSMKEVRDEFISKEMFRQMEKHIDEKFDMLGDGLDKILQKLEKDK